MFYKIAWLCCVAIVSAAPPAPPAASPPGVAPLDKEQPTVIPIISQTDELEPNGTYRFSYETGNGIKREEISYDKILPGVQGRSAGAGEDKNEDTSDEIHVQKGSWSYVAPDGSLIKVSYIADENGFQPVGDHLPRVAGVSNEPGSGEKSGRSLQVADQSEAGSAPAVVAKSAVVAKPAAVPQASSSSESSSSEATITDGTKSSEAPAEASTTILTTLAASTIEAEVTTKSAETSTLSDESPLSTVAASTIAASTNAASTTEVASTTTAAAA